MSLAVFCHTMVSRAASDCRATAPVAAFRWQAMRLPYNFLLRTLGGAFEQLRDFVLHALELVETQTRVRDNEDITGRTVLIY